MMKNNFIAFFQSANGGSFFFFAISGSFHLVEELCLLFLIILYFMQIVNDGKKDRQTVLFAADPVPDFLHLPYQIRLEDES